MTGIGTRNRPHQGEYMEKQKASVTEIREAVNPVFNTARSCTAINALLGDDDAQKLMLPLGFDMTDLEPGGDNITPEMQVFFDQMTNPGFSIMVETRFAASNEYIRKSGFSHIVDLPCGYTPRGIKFADTGIWYYGLDLPAVTEEIEPAAKGVTGENERIRYFDVDATNYTSLKKALSGVQGELLITTEGLLMYLTQSELDEVFQNIRMLLEEHGGEWITTDNEILAAHFRLLDVLSDDPYAPASAQLPPSTPGNDFLDCSKALQYAGKMGFDVKKVPVYNYLPEKLLSLSRMPADRQHAVRDTFKEMYFCVMTVKEDQPRAETGEERPFSIRSDHVNDRLNIALSGRLDTITAPELLSVFRNACEKGEVRSVFIDLRHTSYISSAGLRVFVIILKSLETGEQLHLGNMNDSVREILDMTGFSGLCSCDD